MSILDGADFHWFDLDQESGSILEDADVISGDLDQVLDVDEPGVGGIADLEVMEMDGSDFQHCPGGPVEKPMPLWKDATPEQRAAYARSFVEKSSKSKSSKSKRDRSNKFDKLADAWDGMTLRHGELVDRSDGKRHKRDPADATSLHPNQWTIPGLLRVAYRNVGSHRLCLSGIGLTTHGEAALSVTASLIEHLQAERLSEELLAVSNGNFRSLVLNINHDASPMLLKFGRLHSVVSPHARYLFYDKEKGRWTLKSFEVFKGLTKKRRLGRESWNYSPSLGRCMRCAARLGT